MIKALHPLAAELLIIGVTLAVALAAAALIVGLYHSVHSKVETYVRVYNATLYKYDNGTCVLEALVEIGGGKVSISRVWADGIGTITSYSINGSQSRTLRPGIYSFRAVIEECTVPPTGSGRIWFYTESGMEFPGFYIVVKAGS